MAASGQFSCFSGEAVVLTFSPGEDTSISGWTLVFTVRARRDPDLDTLLTKSTTASTITITDAAAGVFTLTLTAAQTLALGPGRYAFDVWRTDSGSEKPLILGTFTVEQAVRV